MTDSLKKKQSKNQITTLLSITKRKFKENKTGTVTYVIQRITIKKAVKNQKTTSTRAETKLNLTLSAITLTQEKGNINRRDLHEDMFLTTILI